MDEWSNDGMVTMRAFRNDPWHFMPESSGWQRVQSEMAIGRFPYQMNRGHRIHPSDMSIPSLPHTLGCEFGEEITVMDWEMVCILEAINPIGIHADALIRCWRQFIDSCVDTHLHSNHHSLHDEISLSPMVTSVQPRPNQHWMVTIHAIPWMMSPCCFKWIVIACPLHIICMHSILWTYELWRSLYRSMLIDQGSGWL